MKGSITIVITSFPELVIIMKIPLSSSWKILAIGETEPIISIMQQIIRDATPAERLSMLMKVDSTNSL